MNLLCISDMKMKNLQVVFSTQYQAILRVGSGRRWMNHHKGNLDLPTEFLAPDIHHEPVPKWVVHHPHQQYCSHWNNYCSVLFQGKSCAVSRGKCECPTLGARIVTCASNSVYDFEIIDVDVVGWCC